ncbi:MAG: response regulator transcription factor [Akkermansiaceae bacterium]|jgi:two-component system, OmpR family, phosphate regulon response regulator PhoB|nr:response regulator transcription factor [Akkermansiaceae bacterium]
MSDHRYNVLIAEDESDIRDLISFNLEQEQMKTLLAKDGVEAFEIAKERSPDLIVLDLMLPRMDGVTVFKELRQDSRTRDIPVIMLTAKAQLDDVITGLEMGADDYLTKPFSPKELVLRIKALLRRINTTTANSTISSGKFRLDKNTLHCFVSGEQVDLTPTEFKLLLLLVEREGTVQNRVDLLREVWGYRNTVNSRTLDTHIKRLREKLGDLSHCIETVRGVGYQYRNNA